MARRSRTAKEHAIFGRKPATNTPAVPVSKVSLTDIPVPAMVASDPSKLALWNFICADLANRSLLNNSYLPLIEMLIHDIAFYSILLPQLEEEGSVYSTIDKHGNEVKRHNPLFSQVNTLKESIVRKLVLLGMTPRDIIYVSNPAATAGPQIEATAQEAKRIVYFK